MWSVWTNRLSRRAASNILGSRCWSFGVSWCHRSREHYRVAICGFLLVLNLNQPSRKPHTVSPMVTWQMTSRDHKRSRSWPQCLWSLVYQNLCEKGGWMKLTTNRKPMFPSEMTSFDLRRSRSWPNISNLISHNRACPIDGCFKLTKYMELYIIRNLWSRDRWCQLSQMATI